MKTFHSNVHVSSPVRYVLRGHGLEIGRLRIGFAIPDGEVRFPFGAQLLRGFGFEIYWHRLHFACAMIPQELIDKYGHMEDFTPEQSQEAAQWYKDNYG